MDGEKEHKNNDIEVSSETMQEVKRDVASLKEMVELGTQAFTSYTDMKAEESKNNRLVQEHSINTYFKMYSIDRVLVLIIITIMAVAMFMDKMPPEYLWAVLLFSGGYFIRNEAHKRVQSKFEGEEPN